MHHSRYIYAEYTIFYDKPKETIPTSLYFICEETHNLIRKYRFNELVDLIVEYNLHFLEDVDDVG